MHNKKLVDEINDQTKVDRYGIEEKISNADGRLGDINP